MKEIHIKLGEVLKLERERRKISLEDASDQLKISQENIAFVEKGLVDEAPSELYFGLFAKSYAEFLGIDYAGTLEAIQDEYGQLEPDLRASISSDASDDISDPESKASGQEAKREKESTGLSKKGLGWIGIIMAILTGLLLVWILLFDGGSDLTQTDRNGASSESLADGLDSISTQQADQTDFELANYEFGTPPTEAPEPIRFRMVANEVCWATVLADGDPVVFENLIPGQPYDRQANYSFKISIAQPRMVRTFLNDIEVDLRDPETRRISRVEITQVNLSQKMSSIPEAEPEPVINETTIVPPAPASVSSSEAILEDTANQDSAGGL